MSNQPLDIQTLIKSMTNEQLQSLALSLINQHKTTGGTPSADNYYKKGDSRVVATNIEAHKEAGNKPRYGQLYPQAELKKEFGGTKLAFFENPSGNFSIPWDTKIPKKLYEHLSAHGYISFMKKAGQRFGTRFIKKDKTRGMLKCLKDIGVDVEVTTNPFIKAESK